MERNREGSNGITEGVIWKQLLIFFFPLLLGSFFQQLYNTIDAIIVGKFVGKEALSAVGGTTGTLINVLIGFFIGVSAGATVTISQYYGAKNKEEVGKAVHTAIALAIAGGAVIMALGILVAPAALRMIGTPEDIMPYSITFIRIYFLGTIGNLVYNMGASILRAIGDSKRPLYFLMASVALNIALDLLFVAKWHWGVAGVGCATALSQLFSAVLVCITLMRTNDCYRLYLKKIRIHKDLLRKIIRIGLPTGLQSLMYTVSNVVIQAGMNSFGTNTIAAWTAYSKIDGLFWMIMSSFGISITTFVGQNFGAGKYDRMKKGVKVCLRISMSVAVGLSILLYLGGPFIYTWFTNDPLVIQEGDKILHFLVPTFITYVMIEIFSGSLRGMGNSFIPMLLTGLGVCALRVLWILIMVPIWHDVRTLCMSYPISWALTSVLFLIYYNYYLRKQGYAGKRYNQGMKMKLFEE